MSLQEFSGPLNGNCDHKMSRKKAANLALTGLEPYDGHPKKEQETSPWPRSAPKKVTNGIIRGNFAPHL